ncbi:hypothetical protein GpartN1_g5175.t1 [Galdieria partita]|uniref:Uncharacterized protein n=1 Tax=Galdieria partita TaxID=83374 RepID=A0A9C7Q062_9RHOD|nr:hypothetical protein GpartN1_g5175.t1 [Galdieria partita]
MPTNAFRERMESYLKAVEQTANDTFSSSFAKKNKMEKNTPFKQHKLEQTKESTLVKHQSHVTPESVPSIPQIDPKNEDTKPLSNNDNIIKETKLDQPNQANEAHQDVSQTTANSTENSPPVQLVSQVLQESNNSTYTLPPILNLNRPEEKKQLVEAIETTQPKVIEEFKVVPPLQSASKLSHEYKEDSKEQATSQEQVKTLSESETQQPESPTAQIQQNEIPFISTKLKQKFLEYQRQRQQQQQLLLLQQQRLLEMNPESSGQTAVTFAPPMQSKRDLCHAISQKSDQEQSSKNSERNRKSQDISPVHQECVESKRAEMANPGSIQHEIAALREILENFKEKYARESNPPLQRDSWNNVDSWSIPVTYGDERRWNVPLTNHTITPCNDEVTIPGQQRDAGVMIGQDESREHSNVTGLDSTTLSRQENSTLVEQEESAPSPHILPESFTNIISSPEHDGKFSVDIHSSLIERLKSCLQAACNGDIQQFIGFILETPIRNYVDMLLFCLGKLLNEGQSNSTGNMERIQNLEMRILEEQNTVEENLRQVLARQATIRDEIEDYQAKLSRTELALKVALTEKRHLEHRHRSIKLCGSMEDEIGKLESRQEQRERQLHIRMSQKEEYIEQLQQIIAKRDKEIGLVYSEIIELLKNIEQVQDSLKAV